MELRHLRYFVAVAEEKHFGRASKRLRIAQPPLSRQIQELEAELGFSLFDRSRRHVALTPAGEVLLKHTRRVFEELERGVREARRASTGETGHITVGYLSSVAFSGLPELLRAFRARSPAVEVSLRELSPQEQIEALKEGRIDVGFTRGPLYDHDLSSRLVRREALAVALPEDHALVGRSRIEVRALASEPFVVFTRTRAPAFFDFIMRLCRDAGFEPRVVQESPQLDVVSLVAAGFGIAILPGSIRHARRPGVVFRTLAGAHRTELLVVWRPDDTSPVLRDFLEVVRNVRMLEKPTSGRSRAAAGKAPSKSARA